MSKVFICVAPEKEDLNFKGEKLGTVTPKRALYYLIPIGKDRVYRSVYGDVETDMLLYKFRDKDKAQEFCSTINEAYNDNFSIEEFI